MIRIKILKDYKTLRKGQVISLSANEAFGLIDRGYAMVSKDMTNQDYQMKKIVKQPKPENPQEEIE